MPRRSRRRSLGALQATAGAHVQLPDVLHFRRDNDPHLRGDIGAAAACLNPVALCSRGLKSAKPSSGGIVALKIDPKPMGSGTRSCARGKAKAPCARGVLELGGSESARSKDADMRATTSAASASALATFSATRFALSARAMGNAGFRGALNAACALAMASASGELGPVSVLAACSGPAFPRNAGETGPIRGDTGASCGEGAGRGPVRRMVDGLAADAAGNLAWGAGLGDERGLDGALAEGEDGALCKKCVKEADR
jgi:hypothetical protein